MLAACLAFRNAAPYLREWLLFHLVVGFEKFYLYDNDSTDNWRDVVESVNRITKTGQPVVEAIAWPGYFQQNAIYDDCIKRAKNEVKWLAFIDDDEFLYPSADDRLVDILDHFDEFAGVAACWYLFGSSGNIYAADGLITERFTRRCALPDQHVKCVVQPARVIRAIAGGHQFEPAPGFAMVDENKNLMSGALTSAPTANLLRVNHYLVKSIEELVERRTSRDIGYGDKLKLPLVEWIRLDRGWNQVEDRTASRYHTAMSELNIKIVSNSAGRAPLS